MFSPNTQSLRERDNNTLRTLFNTPLINVPLFHKFLFIDISFKSCSLFFGPMNFNFLILLLFTSNNLSIIDLVALSGSHSIGEARCFSIVFRLYNQSGTGRPDPNMNPEYRKKLDELCPKGGDENVTGGLDATPVVFDNQYYKDLVQMKGFLNSDQTLYCGDARTRKVVKKFSKDQGAFFSAFIKGMVRMGDLPSDKRGEIRKNCRVVNDHPFHTTL